MSMYAAVGTKSKGRRLRVVAALLRMAPRTEALRGGGSRLRGWEGRSAMLARETE
eukprot:COSAG06_NODE_44846_length_360_cov_0.486590_2_plen_54_part_01